MSRTRPSARVENSIWVSDIARVGILTAVVKLVGGIKTVVSARVLGLSTPLDAYLIAFSMVSFVCDSLAGTLPPALVPLFVREAESGGRRALEACCAGTLYRSVLLLSTVGAALLTCRGVVLRLLAPGFSAQEIGLTEGLIFVLAPMFPIMGINAVWRSVLHAQSRFAIAAIAPVMTPALATALLLFPHSRPGIYTLAIGSTLGAFAEMLILGSCLLKLQLRLFPAIGSSMPNGGWFKKNYTPLVVSNFVHGGVNIVDQSVASLFAPGSVSTLALGTRLVSVVMAIGPATVSTVVLPTLSRMVAMNDWKILQKTVKQWILLGCMSGGAVAILFILLSNPIAHVLMLNSSSAIHNIRMLANVQALSFFQLPFAVGGVVLVRLILSLQLNRKLVSISILALTANAVLDLMLVRIFGIGGIVVSTALVQALTMAALLWLVRNVFRERPVHLVAA